MVYGPQRRHAVASFATTVQALGLLQHLYTPNILILIARILAQIQINGSAFIHPTRSLFALCMMLSVLNLAASFLHFLDFLGEMNGGKGLVLDFVGQSRPASLTRILLLDLGIYALQLTSLCVSYVNNHSNNLPHSPAFPYEDVLLPPSPIQAYGRGTSSQSLFDENDGEEEDDIESARRKRQKGKGRQYQAVQGDEIWLDDDEEEGIDVRARTSTSATSSNRSGMVITEPPLIFSLSLQHLIHLIISLPAPSAPPRAFSGGTPSASPPRTPVISTPAHLPTPPIPTVANRDQDQNQNQNQDQDREGNEEEEEGDTEYGGIIGRRTASARNTGISRDGRIPGEWRTGEGRGNGG